MPKFEQMSFDGFLDSYKKPKMGYSTGLASLDKLFFGFNKGCVYVLGGSSGMGKEQPVDMPVLTEAGWKPIGAIGVGEKVYGRDGKLTEVIGVFPQGIKQSYKIEFNDNTSTECGLDHLWTVISNRNNERTVTLKKIMDLGLTKGQGYRWKIPVNNAVNFPYKSFEVNPYLLGVLIGDGSLSGRNLRFSCSETDKDIVDQVFTRLPKDVKLRKITSGQCPYYRLVGTGRMPLKRTLEKLGLCVTSKHKAIPPHYLFGNVEQRMDLLRGLMDTDGGSRNNRVNFYTTSEQLAKDVQYLVRSLGGLAHIRIYDRKKDNKSTEYVVVVKMLECPFLCKRKAGEWTKPRAFSKKIVAINKSRVTEQVCIKVKNQDGLYLTNDFIVTHNTALVLDFILASAKKVPVGFMSLEMTLEELQERLVCRVADVNSQKLKAGKLSLEEKNEIRKAIKQIEKLNTIAITESVNCFYPEWRLEKGAPDDSIEKLVEEWSSEGCKVFFIDYLQMAELCEKTDREDIKVKRQMDKLKKLAKKHKVAIVALAQLSGAPDERRNRGEDPKPTMRDLWGSVYIRANADVVMLLYREAYYEKNESPSLYDKETEDALIIVAKNRGGTGGVEVPVIFKPYCCSFCDIEGNLF